MKDDKGIWEETMQSKLQGFEADTNPDDWDIISGKLPQGRRVIFSPYRRFVAAAAAVALLIIGGLHFYPGGDASDDDMIAEVSDAGMSAIVDKEDENDDMPAESDDMPVEKSVNNSPDAPAIHKEQPRAKAVEAVLTAEPPIELKPLYLGDADAEKISVPNIKTIERENKRAFRNTAVNTKPYAEQPVLAASTDTKRRRWGFGMGGGGYAASSSSGAHVPILQAGPMLVEEEYIMVVEEDYIWNGGNMSLRNSSIRSNEELTGKVKHKTPISVGLGISYYLNDRWSLQSGLSYTLLRSEWRHESIGGYPVEWKQNLHFVGIPLSISYNIAEWNRFRLYASTGGMFEYNVAGNRKKAVKPSSFEGAKKENLHMKEPLLSVNARSGIVYPVWRFINIYAEAGVSYYFENKSEIETIRSNKPFDVSLQGGIRLGF